MSDYQLRAIDKRRAEIEQLIYALADDGSYRLQELRTEDNLLKQRRRVIENAIKDRSAPIDQSARERDRRFLEASIKERRANITRAIERAESTGDHREARIWREELLNVPRSICAENHLSPDLIEEISIP